MLKILGSSPEPESSYRKTKMHRRPQTQTFIKDQSQCWCAVTVCETAQLSLACFVCNVDCIWGAPVILAVKVQCAEGKAKVRQNARQNGLVEKKGAPTLCCMMKNLRSTEFRLYVLHRVYAYKEKWSEDSGN